MGSGRFEPLAVKEGESDLWIGLPAGSGDSVKAKTAEAARALVRSLRADILAYDESRPDFRSSLEPIPYDPAAPAVVRAMLDSSRKAGVGPMASVAGAVAQAAGEALVAEFGFREIAVENGGDDYLRLSSPLLASIYSGLTGFSSHLALVVPPELCPLGICASSAKIGPSLSFGNADACVVTCADCALADAYATAFGNLVKREADIEPCLEKAAKIPEILSLVIIKGGKAGVIGSLKLQYL